jgi:hypothetical protein
VRGLANNVLPPLSVAALIALTALCGRAVAADAPTAVNVTRCDLYSHGMTVGHGRIMRTPMLRDGKSCMEVRLMMETHVNMLFFKLSMKMDETWVTDSSGLIAYRWDSTENGQRKTINGELHDGVFRFEIMEAGEKRVWTTPRTAFDVAAISCQPGQTLAAGETKKIRVLDPSTCTIAERSYRGTGAEKLTVGKRELLCDTVMVEYSGTHIKRWFIADEFGPLILREDSDQKRGAYSRCAISMGLEQIDMETH